MDSISVLLIVIPLAPLIAAIVNATLGPWSARRFPYGPGMVTVAALFVSVVASVLLWRELSFRHRFVKPGTPYYERVVELWTWANVRQAFWQRPTPPPLHGTPANFGPRDFRVAVALRADGLTVMMLVTVTIVSLLVAVFSVGYMKGDRGYWRYFSYFSLFVFSMTMLVSASNFLLLYVFWEAVGLCSYLLIGFWYEKPAAAAAGKKAFLVNRVGDFGFALALMLIWITYGTLDFHARAELPNGHVQPLDSELTAPPGVVVQSGVLTGTEAQRVGGVTGLAICLLLLLGACGKSAQFPLHVWLPDAMEGPTPVSALIHAATMVTAGVYMVARCTPLFVTVPEAQLVVAAIGALTALMAAIIAVSQFDLKRVLAYSTISQLGYMFLGLGVGTFAGITSSTFHLFTHAFFKALLFLGAGSVMHAMGNIIDIRRFGGLRHIMPITHWTFFIGCLALAGVFPMSGFWSKDAILGTLHDHIHELSDGVNHEADSAHHAPTVSGDHRSQSSYRTRAEAYVWLTPASARRCYEICFYVALVTAFLTALYTFRAFFLTFYGELRVPAEAGDHAHESPSVMTVPMLVLAVAAATVGFLFDFSYTGRSEYLSGGQVSSGNALADFVGYSPTLAVSAVSETRHAGKFHLDVAFTSMVLALAGMGLAMFLYLEDRREAEWLKYVLSVQWHDKLLDVNTLAAMGRWSWVTALRRVAQQIGVGWLVTILGHLLLAMLWLLTVPILLLYVLAPYRLSANKFYIDQIYQFTIVHPLRGVAALCAAIDRWLVDGFVNIIGKVPVWMGHLMRSLQMGVVSFYALSMVFGALLLLLVRLIWGV